MAAGFSPERVSDQPALVAVSDESPPCCTAAALGSPGGLCHSDQEGKAGLGGAQGPAVPWWCPGSGGQNK